jgi:hypothetical protein
MLDAGYAKHFAAIGKLVYLWDTAGAQVATLETGAARFFDQIATGESASWPASKFFNPYTQSIADAIASGPVALQDRIKSLVGYYLTSPIFLADLETTPVNATQAKSVLEALIAEMADDSKTFTTAASTGFVHFFETLWSPAGSFGQSGTPTYADSTYCVATIV